MGAALTYARRYALFTLVGIAGEDDLDAPDLNSELDDALPGQHIGTDAPPPASISVVSGFAAPPAGAPYSPRGKPVRLPCVILSLENSLALREQLIAELGAFTDTEALTVWAGRILPQKNQLATSDAQTLETAFAVKLGELERDRPAENNLETSGRAAMAASPPQTPSTQLNGHRRPRYALKRRTSPDVSSDTAPEQVVTPIGKTLRMRDRDHLKFVSAQPCLACARSPADAHHLRFAQGRALARKVSDEFTVPLCRSHHRELHRRGDERLWWQQLGIDPLLTASALWRQTHPALAGPEVRAAKPAGADVANGSRFYETKPIIAADTP